MKVEIKEMKNEEEALQMVMEEFPLLTEYAKDAVEMFRLLEKST